MHTGQPRSTLAGKVSLARTDACLPCTAKNVASKLTYSSSLPKRAGVPCRPTGQRRLFSVTMSTPPARLAQKADGLSDSGNLCAASGHRQLARLLPCCNASALALPKAQAA